MKRRALVRSLFLGMASAGWMSAREGKGTHQKSEDIADTPTLFNSKWHRWNDMQWTGEDLWAQRLQDWSVKNEELVCEQTGPDRTIHILTHQLLRAEPSFSAECLLKFDETSPFNGDTRESYAGLRLGLKGRFDDFRSSVFTGKGIDVGISRNGRLFIGDVIGDDLIDMKNVSHFHLKFTLNTDTRNRSVAKLSLLDRSGKIISYVISSAYTHEQWEGSIALVSHTAARHINNSNATVSFRKLTLSGDGLSYQPIQVYGPVYFAQYTVASGTLKLTAQLAPLERSSVQVKLQMLRGDVWQDVADAPIHPLARTASFRLENWMSSERIPYRVVCVIPLRNGKSQAYHYEGSIAPEPDNRTVKALCFSCNWDLGFPDNEVVDHASDHQADIVFFLGDQFYESNGGFGIQVEPLDKACLDYLRKWYQFGWSYRDLFRHCPMIALPDDHDVYHGNIWGAGGRAAIASGGAAIRQDSGGYKMPAEWVNMAQITQTSHMPDPFDPTPALQGIGVYYTSWYYAGIHFAMIEDRKFKTPPKDVLPQEAQVYNGYAGNPTYDRTKELEAVLLGTRQMEFLKQWKTQQISSDFKVLISATSFACLQTLPEGSKNDQVTPQLPVPEKGQYVHGDVPTRDMDSNGWPQKMRDEIVKLLGKEIDLHICGDQHLPSVIQYGADEYADGCWCFTVPSLSNIWPRRWWPSKPLNKAPMPGKPDYCGHFTDGFDNKITVHAVANPTKTGNQPSNLYDRATGFGVVIFEKADHKITLQCWPRKALPNQQDIQQYDGWPFVIEKS